MYDDSIKQLSAQTPGAKSLSADILALTAYGSIFCPASAYPKDGKSLRTKILEHGIKKKFQPALAALDFDQYQFGMDWRIEALRSCTLV
jgi:hypothetical protein